MPLPTLAPCETTQFSPTDVECTLLDAPSPAMPRGVISTLSPSLLSDLKRFADAPGGTELLPALAASVRHARPLTLHLLRGSSLVLLSVFPREQLFHCTLDLCSVPAAELARLRLLHVEPESPLAPTGAAVLRSRAAEFGVLGPLLWRLALHGARGELLPEIAGPVRYRLAAGAGLRGLPFDPRELGLLQRLRSRAASLPELAAATALEPAQLRRLLNALYLQSGLMVTRAFSLPPADAAAASPRR